MNLHKTLALVSLTAVLSIGITLASMINFAAVCRYNEYFFDTMEKDMQYLTLDAYKEVCDVSVVPAEEKEELYDIFTILMDGGSLDGEVKKRINNYSLSITSNVYTHIKGIVNHYRGHITELEDEYELVVKIYNEYINRFPNNIFNKYYNFKDRNGTVYYYKYTDIINIKNKIS